MFHVKHLHLDFLYVSRETLLKKGDLFAEKAPLTKAPLIEGHVLSFGLIVEDNESVSG